MATYITCKRCEGKGRLAHFGHVNNGVCLNCYGAGKVVKCKRVTTFATHFVACDDRGNREYCGTDKARAEMLATAWRAMGVMATIEEKQVKKITSVPV